MSRLARVRDLIGAVAPDLAHQLGGPLAGVAVRKLAEELGLADADDETIERRLDGATAEDLGRLREAEASLKRELADAGVEIERVSAGDRASARARQTQMQDWTPSVLGSVIVLGFLGLLGAQMIWPPVEGASSEVVVAMVGALGAMTVQVGNYFFGSSAGSKSKNAIIAGLKGAR